MNAGGEGGSRLAKEARVIPVSAILEEVRTEVVGDTEEPDKL